MLALLLAVRQWRSRPAPGAPAEMPKWMAGLAGGEQAVALAVFVLIGSIGVLAPLIVYLVAGARAAETLDTWRTWAADHNAAVMAVLFLVFGFKLVGDGIAVLF